MNVERKPSITELIEALELHLSPHTDPSHCDPCIYNPTNAENLEVPQTTYQYRLMRDCLDKLQTIKEQEEELFWIKDFIEYTLISFIPTNYLKENSIFSPVEFAFVLGAAFEHYKSIWED